MLCKTVILLAIAGIAIGAAIEKPVDYSKHQIVRVLPNDPKNVEDLAKLQVDFDMKVDFWNPPMLDMRPVLTLVGPQQTDFLRALNSSNIKYEIAAQSFQKVIDKEREQNLMAKKASPYFDYETVYHTYAEIVAELKSVDQSSSKVTYSNIGKTYEGRDIPSVTVTNPGGGSKPAIFLECGIHAREWITPAFCLWTMNKLISDSSLDSLMNRYRFIIVPTLNPDGYVYTWSTNRQWRKTRSRNGLCYGADPNRNWDAAHCQTGASTNACSDTYCGPSPFSESEAKAMADLVTANRGNIDAYFSVHSYSQLWMWPYGYSNAQVPNTAKLRTISQAGVAAIKNVNGLTFEYGPIAQAIYIASGSSIDWVYDKIGAVIAFALELRDKGQYGFVLPPAQIKPACLETWAGLKAAIDNL